MCEGYERKPGAASLPLTGGYHRHEPEKTVLYQAIAEELATFRERSADLADGAGLPGFVLREFERFLDCAILAKGFARVRCPRCKEEILVGFSCKSRGLCPSCGARRMSDTAAHLVDRVLPAVPVRQWVLSFPKWLRFHLARDPGLAAAARDQLLAAIFVWQRRAARSLGLPKPGVGGVVFSQRFGDSLNLHPHLHAIVPDGVFTRDRAQALFHRLPRPRDEDVQAIAERIVIRIRRLLVRRGLIETEIQPDTLDFLAAEALRPRPAPLEEPRHLAPLCAFVEGYSLHAGTHVHENDRPGLEHLLRYGARPPVALSRLQREADGAYVYQLKYPLPDGTYELRLTGQELMGRLALLVPRPRVHLVTYRGVFAPHSSWRPLIVPVSPRRCSHPDAPRCGPPTAAVPTPLAPLDDAYVPPKAPSPRERYLDWASLLSRVFAESVLRCPNCGGTRTVVAFIEDPAVARKILDHLGLPSTGPPLAPARAPPQADLFVA